VLALTDRRYRLPAQRRESAATAAATKLAASHVESCQS